MQRKSFLLRKEKWSAGHLRTPFHADNQTEKARASLSPCTSPDSPQASRHSLGLLMGAPWLFTLVPSTRAGYSARGRCAEFTPSSFSFAVPLHALPPPHLEFFPFSLFLLTPICPFPSATGGFLSPRHCAQVRYGKLDA